MCVSCGLLCRFYSQRHLRQHPRTFYIKGIEGACTNQGLHRTTIHHAPVYALTEIKDVFKWATARTCRDDGINGVLTCALHCPEAVANGLRIDRCKAEFRMIDVRTKNSQAVCFGIIMENLHRVGVIHIR